MDPAQTGLVRIDLVYPLRGVVFACIYKEFSPFFLEHMVNSVIKFCQ